MEIFFGLEPGPAYKLYRSTIFVEFLSTSRQILRNEVDALTYLAAVAAVKSLYINFEIDKRNLAIELFFRDVDILKYMSLSMGLEEL